MTDLQTAHEAYRKTSGVCKGCTKGLNQVRMKHLWSGAPDYDWEPCTALSFEVWADQRDKTLRVENGDLKEELESVQQRLESANYFIELKKPVLAERLTTGVESPETNTPIRMHLALKMLRAWNSGTEGYDSSVLLVVNEWIDGGMKGPIPWPDSPFFAEWAAKSGLSNVSGNVGFRFMATILPVVESPAQESVNGN